MANHTCRYPTTRPSWHTGRWRASQQAVSQKDRIFATRAQTLFLRSFHICGRATLTETPILRHLLDNFVLLDKSLGQIWPSDCNSVQGLPLCCAAAFIKILVIEEDESMSMSPAPIDAEGKEFADLTAAEQLLVCEWLEENLTQELSNRLQHFASLSQPREPQGAFSSFGSPSLLN
jgi:hypothetical protein